MSFDQAQQQRILTPPVRRLMDALASGGGEARAVGGAVRDVILNRKPGDIDLATNLHPGRVIEILAAAKIKTVPTGIDHGTITAVVDGTGYEITTLRRDVATDGRHAQVAFTGDWKEDAARRDFTFNALYLDANGTLYDYFDGAADAQHGLVRFIGDARARILEDTLRILRFFRFYAWFGRGDADADALQACRDLAEKMLNLSAERVARETLKLLAAPDPSPAWRLMCENNITEYILPQASDTARLEALIRAEKNAHAAPSPLLRLAALLPQDDEVASSVASRLKLSNRDAAALRAFAVLPSLLRAHLDPVPLRRILYAHGADNVRTALLLTEGAKPEHFATIAVWENPAFPLKGEDIVRLGIPAGPEVGEMLRAAEDWWISNDFRPDRAACLAQLAVASLSKSGKNH